MDSEPFHGSYYKIMAKLTWKVKNHLERAHGSFPVDTGCTWLILNQEKVRTLNIPVYQRQQGIQISDIDRAVIQGAGL